MVSIFLRQPLTEVASKFRPTHKDVISRSNKRCADWLNRPLVVVGSEDETRINEEIILAVNQYLCTTAEDSVVAKFVYPIAFVLRGGLVEIATPRLGNFMPVITNCRAPFN